MKFSPKILPLSVVALLGLAACGGSDSTVDSAPAPTDVVSDDGAAEAAEAADGEVTVEPDSATNTDAPVADASGSESSVSLDGDLCSRIDNLRELVERLDDPSGADEAVQLQTFEDFVATLDSVAEVAPDDAAADVKVLADGFRVLALFGGGGAEPTPEQIALLDSPEYALAGDRFEDFARDECNIELG